MKYIVLIFFISPAAWSKTLLPDAVEIHYRFGDRHVDVKLAKDKTKYSSFIRFPDGRAKIGFQSRESLEAIVSELKTAKTGIYRPECRRNYISFILKTAKKENIYSTCIGAKNTQAQKIIGLFDAVIMSMM